jgi:hypothetical protein
MTFGRSIVPHGVGELTAKTRSLLARGVRMGTIDGDTGEQFGPVAPTYLPPRVVSVRVESVDDDSPDLSYLDTDDPTDRERRESYYRDEWSMIGIRAVAEIEIPAPQGGWAYRTEIRSAGLWEVESDSDASYLSEIATQELGQLADLLVDGFGMDRDAVDAAVKDAEQ